MDIRKPVKTKYGSISCEINHPELGWIEFHATEDDKTSQGKLIYERLLNGEAGDIAPYEPENDSSGVAAGDPNQ